jgi:hypothetical protein
MAGIVCGCTNDPPGLKLDVCHTPRNGWACCLAANPSVARVALVTPFAVGSETATGVGLGELDGLALGDAAAEVGVADGVAVPPLHAATTISANSGIAI